MSDINENSNDDEYHLLGGEYYAPKLCNILKGREFPSAIEVCCGVGLIGKELKKNKIVNHIWYSDIVDMSNYCDNFILSDALESISCKFDLIICCPPWYNVRNSPKGLEQRGRILWQDMDWEFHQRFYQKLPSILKTDGVALVTGAYESRKPNEWLDMCKLQIVNVYDFTEPRGSVEYPENYIIEWARLGTTNV